jgi:hypothetical protein
MSLTYASFEPLPTHIFTAKPAPTDAEKEKQEKIMRNRLRMLGAVEIKSDYLGVSTYYYSKKDDIIYEVDNVRIQLLKPTAEVESHLRQLNNLPQSA